MLYQKREIAMDNNNNQFNFDNKTNNPNIDENTTFTDIAKEHNVNSANLDSSNSFSQDSTPFAKSFTENEAITNNENNISFESIANSQANEPTTNDLEENIAPNTEFSNTTNNENEDWEEVSTIKDADKIMFPEKNLPHLAFRLLLVLLAFFVGAWFVTLPESYNTRIVLGIVFITIFLIIPRLFIYSRYQKVYFNEELKTGFKPKGFIRRAIFATRVTLANTVVLFLTALMVLYTFSANSSNGLTTLIISGISFVVLNFLLSTEKGIQLMRATQIPTIYPYYKRWTAILGSAFFAFLWVYFGIDINITSEQALTEVAQNLISQNSNSAISLFGETLRLTSALQTYVYSLSQHSFLEPIIRFVLIALPYTIMALHTSLCLSLLSLPKNEYKFVYGKQDWVKTDNTLFKRYWKTVTLPIFLICCAIAGYKYGYPYYVKYVEQTKETQITKEVFAFEKINNKYYKIGTKNSINNAKLAAFNNLKNTLATITNEINAIFDESMNHADYFAKWYIASHKNNPFTPKNKQLKQALRTGLNIENIENKISRSYQNIQETANNTLSELGIEINNILAQNVIENVTPKANEKVNEIKDADKLINILSLNFGKEVNIYHNFDLKLPRINIQEALEKTVDNPKSFWFKPAALNIIEQEENDALEKSLFGEDNNQEDANKQTDNSIDEEKLMIFLTKEMDSISERYILGISTAMGIEIDYTDDEKNSDKNSNTDTIEIK